MKSRSFFAVSLSLLLAAIFVFPASIYQGGRRVSAANISTDFWGTSETFWNVSTGTAAPATFDDMILVEQAYTDSVVLDGWLWEMTKASMDGTVAWFSPSGPAGRTNDWNISVEITRPREDSAYLSSNISAQAGSQSLIIYLTNQTGFVLTAVNLTTGSYLSESIGVYSAPSDTWSQVADDLLPAFPHDSEDFGYRPDHYVVAFAHVFASSEVEIVVRNTGSGIVFIGNVSVPTIEGADNPQLRFDIESAVGKQGSYNIAGGWIVDNLMFRSLKSRYPVVGPVYERVAKSAPLWLEVGDIDGGAISDCEVYINGTLATYNAVTQRYEAYLDRAVDWDVRIPCSVLVDGVLVNDTLEVSTTLDPAHRASLPRWWNGWDWVTVLGKDDATSPLSAPLIFSGYYHPKTSYINSGFLDNSTDLLATQSEIAIHFPHDLAFWGHKFWDEAVTSAQTGHSTFENSYWFASRWDDPRYVGKGDSYISLANPGNSGSWEQLFAEYARGTRMMGICSQYYLAGNSSLMGSYWMYGPTNAEIPSWASWHPNTRLDLMDMFRGLNTDTVNPNEWSIAYSVAQASGVLRIYNHIAVADPVFLHWLCDNKTNLSYENWKATDGEVASYIYGSRSTDVVYDLSSTYDVWTYDVSRRSPYVAGYWNVPVTVAIDISEKKVSDVEVMSGSWDLKASDGSLRDLQGNRTMDVGFDIRGSTLYVSYFWNASSILKVYVTPLSNPRPISKPVTTALAWDNYSCTVLSTAPDNGTTTWTLAEAPNWLSIESMNDTSCVLTGLPKARGDFDVRLTISDLNSTTYLNWTITVLRLKFVSGHVRDSGAKPVSNVTVMIAFKSGSDIRSIKYTSTNDSGYFSVMIPEDDWHPGDKVEVSSFYDNETAVNQTTADDYPHQEIDLRFAADVPEFGSLFGVVLAVVALALIACFILLRRRR